MSFNASNYESTDINRLFLIPHMLVSFCLPKGSWNKLAKYEKLGCTWNLVITNAYNHIYGMKNEFCFSLFLIYQSKWSSKNWYSSVILIFMKSISFFVQEFAVDFIIYAFLHFIVFTILIMSLSRTTI